MFHSIHVHWRAVSSSDDTTTAKIHWAPFMDCCAASIPPLRTNLWRGVPSSPYPPRIRTSHIFKSAVTMGNITNDLFYVAKAITRTYSCDELFDEPWGMRDQKRYHNILYVIHSGICSTLMCNKNIKYGYLIGTRKMPLPAGTYVADCKRVSLVDRVQQ